MAQRFVRAFRLHARGPAIAFGVEVLSHQHSRPKSRGDLCDGTVQIRHAQRGCGTAEIRMVSRGSAEHWPCLVRQRKGQGPDTHGAAPATAKSGNVSCSEGKERCCGVWRWRCAARERRSVAVYGAGAAKHRGGQAGFSTGNDPHRQGTAPSRGAACCFAAATQRRAQRCLGMEVRCEAKAPTRGAEAKRRGELQRQSVAMLRRGMLGGSPAVAMHGGVSRWQCTVTLRRAAPSKGTAE